MRNFTYYQNTQKKKKYSIFKKKNFLCFYRRHQQQSAAQLSFQIRISIKQETSNNILFAENYKCREKNNKISTQTQKKRSALLCIKFTVYCKIVVKGENNNKLYRQMSHKTSLCCDCVCSLLLAQPQKTQKHKNTKTQKYIKVKKEINK